MDFEANLNKWNKNARQIGNHNSHVNIFSSIIQLGHLPLVQDDCHWNEHTGILAAQEEEHITSYHPSFSIVYTYHSLLGLFR